MNRHLAALIAFAILATAPVFASQPTEIVATGSGTVALTPDIAVVSATISTNAQNASQAVSANNARYDKAVAAVTATGVARDDITLVDYNVNYNPKPQDSPERPDGQQYGYTVSRSFDVKVRTMTKAGSVVDAVTSVDGVSVGGVTFSVADSSRGRKEAITRAVSDARSQAQASAAAAGLHIVGIKQIDQSGAPVIQPMGRAMAMAAPVPTNLEASSVNVRADVTITFLAQP